MTGWGQAAAGTGFPGNSGQQERGGSSTDRSEGAAAGQLKLGRIPGG
ncbi:hypothetical protein [Cohnella thermotolerans]|nr:hypothetical protein [Cohnella thermotolerans]